MICQKCNSNFCKHVAKQIQDLERDKEEAIWVAVEEREKTRASCSPAERQLIEATLRFMTAKAKLWQVYEAVLSEREEAQKCSAPAGSRR